MDNNEGYFVWAKIPLQSPHYSSLLIVQLPDWSDGNF